MGNDHFDVMHDDSGVQYWADDRLPYEPSRDWHFALRFNVQAALGELRAGENHALHGVYLTRKCGFYDVENVLFYNIGAGHFAKSTRFGLRFETAITIPPSAPAGRRRNHYCRYAIVPITDGFRCWRLGEIPVATWIDIPLATQPSSKTKASQLWFAVCKHGFQSSVQRLEGKFGLKLCLTAPEGIRRQLNLASIVKPLFDGVIAALQRYPGDVPGDALDRLHCQINMCPKDQIRRWLQTSNAPLGDRAELIRSGGNRLWNPRDDDCKAGEFIVRVNPESQGFHLSGTLHSVEQVGTSADCDAG
jgi:hypothetical protein